MSGIEIVGLLLAVPGIVQIFFETGEKIYEKMKNDKKMKDCARDLGKFLIDDGRAQLNRDFELARIVLKDQNTRNDEKERISRLFRGALEQLQHMSDLATIILSSDILEFRKRSAALKDLKDRITDIRTSMSEFHQLVMSLHTIAVSEPPLLLEDQDFTLTGAEQSYDVLNATTLVVRGRLSRSLSSPRLGDGRFLLESKPYTTSSMKSVKKDLRILSQKLAVAEESSGILPLIGFRENPSRNEFQLVFGIPPGGGTIQTLESVYHRPKPSLNFRIHLCGQLAEAVLQTHMLGLVHKHIRPENMILLSMSHEAIADEPFPTAFLCGWQYARSVDGGVTRLAGEGLWQRAVYQHPERQGEHVEEEYCMGHDIYSLGVCMLEILTWSPLVTGPDGNMEEASISQPYRTLFDQHGSIQGNRAEPLDVERLVQDPETVQRTLLRMTETLVPIAAGGRMRNLVSQCLTCLDGEANIGRFRVSKEREDKDVAVNFVDTVLKDIRRVMNAI